MNYDRRDGLFFAAMSVIMLVFLLYIPIADPKHIEGQVFLIFVLIVIPLGIVYMSGWGE